MRPDGNRASVADFSDPLAASALLRHRSVHDHWLSERVRWTDTDQVGHVNNLSISNYCELGRVSFLEPYLAPGVALRAPFLIVRMNTSFLGEVHWPAFVDVGTRVPEIRGSSVRLADGVFLAERCVATADSILVHIDEATRKAKSIPDEVRRYLGEHLTRRGVPEND